MATAKKKVAKKLPLPMQQVGFVPPAQRREDIAAIALQCFLYTREYRRKSKEQLVSESFEYADEFIRQRKQT